MRSLFLLVLISAVAAAPLKRGLLPFALAATPTAPASPPAATASKYPTPPGALPAFGGGVRGVESALPAVGNTPPAVAGSLDKGLVGSLVGPQRRDLAGGDAVDKGDRPSGGALSGAAGLIKNAAGNVQGGVLRDFFPEGYYATASFGWASRPTARPRARSEASVDEAAVVSFVPADESQTDAFVKPTGTYYPFETASVDWKRQYGAGNGGEYGAGAEYGGGAGYGNPYAESGKGSTGGYAGGNAYSGNVGAGYGYGSHTGYDAGANAGGYTYVKSSGSISGSYEGIMEGGEAMDGYGRAGMGSHAEADMNGRLWHHGAGQPSPAYDASVSSIPAEPTAAPPAVHVPIAYAPVAPDAADPPHPVPGPMISGEEPSYRAAHGVKAYNIPEGLATDVPLQPYTPTDEPQNTAYPEPTYTANVASEAPIDNSPATYDYPAAAKPTEWSYPTAAATEGLPIYSTPTADGYPSEEKPSEWVYPSVNEGSDYTSTDAPTPTFDPNTYYTTAPAPHGLGMAPWGPGPAEEVKPTMEVEQTYAAQVEPTYAAQAVPTEAASTIYK
ncbi:hypothetical protein K523DRAFT_412513 [Schizophyllum commune Tattone D]|nr:hypothetical protein K523DRAFT_412513 [Schizophyllum commune Tattone D]